MSCRPFKVGVVATLCWGLLACGGDGGDSSSGSDGPGPDENPNVHATGDAGSGMQVFRFETFGNEGFWTDAMRLPQGLVAAGVTPIDALKAGLNVNVDALDAGTQQIVLQELQTDLSPANAPVLNDPATTVALVNANAVIGVVVRDSNGDGRLDVANGDKLGLSCALCHAITDSSVVKLPGGGSIGKQIDGPTPHELRVGTILALAANSRAFYPMLQLSFDTLGGATIGRAPRGITETSSEAEVDAYLADAASYPVGQFDAFPDGVGNTLRIAPFFRTDLSAPWGIDGGVSLLDDFNNTVFTVSLDPTSLVTAGGRAFLRAQALAVGDEIADDYLKVLTETGVVPPAGGFPYVRASTSPAPGSPAGVTGRRVDDQKLLDLNAYLDSLPAPAAVAHDEQAARRGRDVFRSSCTSCHDVDQSRFVPPMVVPMATMFPGYSPVVIAERPAPLSPIQDSPGSTFDDRMVVLDASRRGLERGVAMPLLLDLPRKPAFLHDDSVPSLDALLDPARGAQEPHPFYVADAAERAAVIEFLKSLQDH